MIYSFIKTKTRYGYKLEYNKGRLAFGNIVIFGSINFFNFLWVDHKYVGNRSDEELKMGVIIYVVLVVILIMAAIVLPTCSKLIMMLCWFYYDEGVNIVE